MKKQVIYAGIDLGGTNIKGGLVTRDGEVSTQKKIPTEARKGVDYVLERIMGFVQDIIDTDRNRIQLRALGIGVPGQIDVKNGVVVASPNLPGWNDVKIGSILKKSLGVSVSVDNDANVAALGEFSYGAGKGVNDMLMVTLGTGVGGGLILRGEVYRGAGGIAGEFGHLTIQHNGPLCACGRRGCVEAFVGTAGILRRIREKLKISSESLLTAMELDRIMPKDVGNAAEKGDKTALEVLNETGMYLGIGLGNVVNLLNIERVVVGGGVANAGEFILGPTRENLARVALKVPGEMVDVVPAVLGDRAGILGAAYLAMLESKVNGEW